MPNEKKTEDLVRSSFKEYYNIINFEEQKSDNPKIDKLLKQASKGGNGKGYPEFLITFKNNNEFLIVIECKAENSKHESLNKDKYVDYAVDGVLLYSSYLSKEFDVLAIAVSGETETQLKVSHFLQLKNEKKAEKIFGDKLLSPQDYIDGYIKSPEKFRQDYNTLLEFTQKLNDNLHTNKILESQRSLLISAILIALDDEAFKSSYKLIKNAKKLANSITETVYFKLREAKINPEKLENLNIQFSFIKTDTSISTKDEFLLNLIDEIDNNINKFIKTHEYFDVLGQMYIEFLRYANSDKGLGIVLTPPHITEFFAELAQVNKDSIAFDNCLGTGGFLIAAMKRMIADANGDSKKILDIKEKQLIGVEYQAHIYALAVSNMYIHQDGKTNILNGSCFNEEIIKIVKAQKPTVGFLNPPYKSNKKNDIDEFKFILNNLECLEPGGVCIAIVPMSCALAINGKALEYKKKLLQKHTLEAVFSMPDELFIDSNVGTVTCIMIFTAHRPHIKNKKTFFGYFKNDGFENRRKGRIDIYNKWKDIKIKWIKSFINKEEDKYLSINIEINENKEWCPEAYLRTDFTKLSHENFKINLKEHCIYLFNNELTKEISIKKINDDLIDLNLSNFRLIKVLEIFDIYSGGDKPNKNDSLHWGGELVNSIENQTSNNGVKEKIEFSDESKIFKNFISLVSIGDGGKAYYQPEKSVCFTRVKALIPKKIYSSYFNKYVFMFFCTILDIERYRYSYGRILSKERLLNTEMYIPFKNEQPDFEYMENYIKTLPYSSSI